MDAGKAESESERRIATILFADISGFSSISERLDPELVTALMNACFDALGAVVNRHGGRIDKFIGDCAMALFGAPQALEKAPLRALEAATEMLAAVEDVGRAHSLHEPLRLHIGVNTGLVLAGSVGSAGDRAFTVMGDAVNLAARLKDLSPPGAVYVGPETRGALHGECRFRELKPVAVKGKEKPLPVFELLGLRDGSGEDRGPFVGRAAEITALETALGSLRKEGRGFAALIIGEPGIGKSRLVAELSGRSGLAEVLRLEGKALAFGRHLQYHPFSGMFRAWAGIGEEEGEAAALAKLEAAILTVAGSTAIEIFPFVARVLGFQPGGSAAERLRGIEGEALERLVFSKIRALLSLLAAKNPLCVVLEDLHWADQTSLELLKSLLRLTETAPLGFMMTARPDFEESGTSLIAALRELPQSRQLRLDALDPAQSGGLVDRLVGNRVLPASLRNRIVERSGGNPYFIEEVVRSLVYAEADSFQDAHVPMTISDLLMTRIDRLDDTTRNLVRIASVIGRNFSYRVLAEIASSIDELGERLRRLTDSRLIVEEEGSTELEYLFRHALAQEVAYESLLLQRRRELHTAVAEAIERLFPDRLAEFAGMLAYHYGRADLPDKAEEYLVRAGEGALRAAASNEALAYYTQALQLYLKMKGKTADPARVAMLERNIARSLYAKGRYGECLPYYEKLLAAYPCIPPLRGIRQVLAALGGAIRVAGFFARRPTGNRALEAWRKEAYDLAREYVNAVSQIDAVRFFLFSVGGIPKLMDYDFSSSRSCQLLFFGMSSVFSWTGISFVIGRRILELASSQNALDDPIVQTSFGMNSAAYTSMYGTWKSHGFHDPSVVHRAVQEGELWEATSFIFMDGVMRLELGELDEVAACLRELDELDREFDNDYVKDLRNILDCRTLFKSGTLDDLARGVERALSFIRRTEFVPDIASVLGFAARMHILRGDLEAAAASIAEAARITEKSEGFSIDKGCRLGAAAVVAVEKARRAAASGKLAGQTRKEARAAVNAYRRNSRKCAVDIVEALKLAGQLAWHEGSPRRAESAWRRAIAEGERLGARLELGRTLVEAGDMLGGRGPGPEWARRGRELLGLIGAKYTPA